MNEKFVKDKYLNMKKYCIFFWCLGVLAACQRESGYKIIGSVPGTPDGMKVYLYNWNTPVDSGVVKSGKFVLMGKVDVPVRYQLWVDLSPDKKGKICAVRIFSLITRIYDTRRLRSIL